jgi:hypothetical protein
MISIYDTETLKVVKESDEKIWLSRPSPYSGNEEREERVLQYHILTLSLKDIKISHSSNIKKLKRSSNNSEGDRKVSTMKDAPTKVSIHATADVINGETFYELAESSDPGLIELCNDVLVTISPSEPCNDNVSSHDGYCSSDSIWARFNLSIEESKLRLLIRELRESPNPIINLSVAVLAYKRIELPEQMIGYEELIINPSKPQSTTAYIQEIELITPIMQASSINQESTEGHNSELLEQINDLKSSVIEISNKDTSHREIIYRLGLIRDSITFVAIAIWGLIVFLLVDKFL